MKHLHTYARAILRNDGPATIERRAAETAAWQDQGFTVRREIATYHFSNGAVVRRAVERDDFPSGAACAECWIGYEVLSHPDGGPRVEPAAKSFDNACREAFWLAYHTAPGG